MKPLERKTMLRAAGLVGGALLIVLCLYLGGQTYRSRQIAAAAISGFEQGGSFVIDWDYEANRSLGWTSATYLVWETRVDDSLKDVGYCGVWQLTWNEAKADGDIGTEVGYLSQTIDPNVLDLLDHEGEKIGQLRIVYAASGGEGEIYFVYRGKGIVFKRVGA